MKIDDIVQKVIDNLEKKPFDITTIIKEEDFDFDNTEYFKYKLKDGEVYKDLERKENEKYTDYYIRNLVEWGKFFTKQKADESTKENRQKLLKTARNLGDTIKCLYIVSDLMSEFDFTKQEKKECWTSDGLRDEFRNLKFEDGFDFSNDIANTTSESTQLDFKKQFTIWKRKLVYKLISEVKDEQYYAEFFGVDNLSEPKDYSNVKDWKAFADKIGEPTFTPGKALTAGRAIRRPFKSYLWDGKASEWLNSFTCHHRWKAAENGKVLISDKAGETICFDKGLPTINHSYGTGNNAYYLELRRKVNEVG
jgi:hypothetical protein